MTSQALAAPLDLPIKISVRDLTVHYGAAVGLDPLTHDKHQQRLTAVIGP
jgi:hypothetical protein